MHDHTKNNNNSERQPLLDTRPVSPITGTGNTTHYGSQQKGQKDTPHKDSWRDLRPYARPLIAVNCISLFCGLNDGNFGVILPRLKEYYKVPDETVSILFFVDALGFFFSAAANGYLVQKLGQRNALSLGAVSVALSYILIGQGFAFNYVAAFMFMQGASIALLDAGMNVIASGMPRAGFMLSIVHSVYGVGGMLSPMLGTTLLASHSPWNYIYYILSGFAMLILLVIALGVSDTDTDSTDQEHVDDTEGDSERRLRRSPSSTSSKCTSPSTSAASTSTAIDENQLIRKALFHPITITCAIYILVYIGAEVSVGGWAYTYLVEGRHGDMIKMGHVVSGYWAGLAVGRIVLGYLAEKYGVRLMVALFCIITEVCVAVLWAVDVIAVDSAAIICIGFFLGPMLPGVLTLASNALPKSMHATSIGFMTGVGAGGAALFPFMTGQISGHFGIQSFPATLLCMIALTFCLWLMVAFKAPSEGEKDLQADEEQAS
ncbi:major facilitator superfamily domain-containing protein [Syncephalastrum racemosum]|uniref:Major facilitator superfamily domain-containing protein n=1 Tax=Syncephalastrum racemosum TaxID=13706 RepID=A0A1X2H7G4_SYNRA|nr:major facilitator superfamily domain-containing protein [Syncephalastrum racemosum]